MWPDFPKYAEEIQNPHLCFTDSDLRLGNVVLNSQGWPQPISGRFGVVFQIRGTRSWAVKCFTHRVEDQHERYNAISEHIKGKHIPALVDFAYLRQGMVIERAHYPIVKMEWVDGQSLSRYIKTNIQDASILQRLAREWIKAIKSLQEFKIAHGDLQNGNIIVHQEQIKLVDYDGMFVPALRGKKSKELGVEHFQHPARTAVDFSENLDNFSSIVIYLSILALSYDPNLWDNHHISESIIFNSKDFTHPKQALIWQRLANNPSSEVQDISKELVHLSNHPLSQTPSLLDLLGDTTSPAMSMKDWVDLAGLKPASQSNNPDKTMTAEDWQNLGTLPEIGKSENMSVRDWMQLGSFESYITCSLGHQSQAGDFNIYCPTCATAGNPNPLYGWEIAPCKHKVPSKSKYCPQCGKSTGW